MSIWDITKDYFKTDMKKAWEAKFSFLITAGFFILISFLFCYWLLNTTLIKSKDERITNLNNQLKATENIILDNYKSRNIKF